MARDLPPLSPIEEGLRDILEAEYRFWGDNFYLLAERIAEANGKRPGFRIDRRKLADAINHHKLDFTVSELVALENYLRRHHRPRTIGHLFEQSRLPQALTERGKVMFLLGTRSFPGIGTVHLSWWDVHAMAEVLRAMQLASPGVDFSCEDVLVHSRDMVPAGTPFEVYFGQKEWYKLLEDREDSPTLLLVGSSRACHAAEIALSKMLNVPAFVSVDVSAPRVPFFFYWDYTARPGKQLPSCVAPGVTVRPGEAGLWLQGEYHPIDESGDPSHGHGLIVAQRRPFGQLWVLVMGTSGPLTTAAAREMASVMVHLPHTPGQASRVWWQAVWGNYTGKAPRPVIEGGQPKPLATDGRKLLDHHAFGDPHWWPS